MKIEDVPARAKLAHGLKAVHTRRKRVNFGLAVDGHACHVKGTSKIPQAPHVRTSTRRHKKHLIKEKQMMHRLTNNPVAYVEKEQCCKKQGVETILQTSAAEEHRCQEPRVPKSANSVVARIRKVGSNPLAPNATTP